MSVQRRPFRPPAPRRPILRASVGGAAVAECRIDARPVGCAQFDRQGYGERSGGDDAGRWLEGTKRTVVKSAPHHHRRHGPHHQAPQRYARAAPQSHRGAQRAVERRRVRPPAAGVEPQYRGIDPLWITSSVAGHASKQTRWIVRWRTCPPPAPRQPRLPAGACRRYRP